MIEALPIILTSPLLSKINTNNKIAQFRNDFTTKQAKRSNILQKTAITKGSTGVYKDSRARYPQNKDKTVVKFRKTNIGSLLDSTFNDDNKFIEPRNKNFKQIYIYLASNEIFGICSSPFLTSELIIIQLY